MEAKNKRHQTLIRQIERLQPRLVALKQRSERYSYLRLITFVGGFILNGLTFLTIGPEWLWLTFIGSAVLFLSVVYIHNQIEGNIARHTIWLKATQAQVARMTLDWAQIPPSQFWPDNALALDLDLVGSRSLHRLLNTAVSSQGGLRLKEWLTNNTPIPEKTKVRQRRVMELVNRPLFRKRLILNGVYASGERESATPERLLQWLQAQPIDPTLRQWVWGLGLLALLNLVLLAGDLLANLPALWQGTLALYVILALYKSLKIDEPFKAASHVRDILEQLVAVFRQLEDFSYSRTPHLGLLCRPFHSSEQKPSAFLRRLNLIVNATGIRGNPILALLLNILFPYDLFFAYQLERAKQALAGRMPEWLDIWFEIEALASLANLAYLNPHYTFPELNSRQSKEKALFMTQKMSHPLLPDEQKICNDFIINQGGFIGVLTGSNMSGKSTFLRTMGMNLALAYSGGPVDAASLDTIYFRLHTCIRISDSITSGISHFYAEVRCLKALMNALEREHPLPLFYLIDEIFQGTNNRERLTGSRSYIRALAAQSGVGLISTHDLELAQLAVEITSLRNFHFRDSVEDGRLLFDYTIQPGPSPTTNALKIMAIEGLPLDD